jgi:hypothetical protein
MGLPPEAAWVPLLKEVLAREGRCRWPLRGNSMRPTLPAECEIEVVPLPADAPLGALIVFAGQGALVAHRLVRRSGRWWLTQGDNRRSPDCVLEQPQVLGLVQAAYTPDGRRCWPTPLAGALAWFWIARYHMYRGVRFMARGIKGLFPAR